MATTGDVHKGMFILHNKKPYYIIDREFYKPGKGGAYNKLKLRDLNSNAVIPLTLKSNEKVEEIDVPTKDMQYLYEDGGQVYFMDPKTFEQINVDLDMIPGEMDYLHVDGKYLISYYDGQPITVQIPLKMTLEVTSTPMGGDKGNTATGATKEATLETGAKIQVPLFVKQGGKVVINTESGTYYSKA